VRVAVTGDESKGLKTTAFVNIDGSVAVNVINTGTDSVSFRVVGVKGGKTVRAWKTDAENDMTQLNVGVNADGTKRVHVSGRGMVSLVIAK
jgi:hypothetical protein